eukprot:9875714-Prorocentrum_lima.AAC.1
MARTSRQNFLPAGRQVEDQGTNSKPRSVGQSKSPGEASRWDTIPLSLKALWMSFTMALALSGSGAIAA